MDQQRSETPEPETPDNRHEAPEPGEQDVEQGQGQAPSDPTPSGGTTSSAEPG